VQESTAAAAIPSTRAAHARASAPTLPALSKMHMHADERARAEGKGGTARVWDMARMWEVGMGGEEKVEERG